VREPSNPTRTPDIAIAVMISTNRRLRYFSSSFAMPCGFKTFTAVGRNVPKVDRAKGRLIFG